MEHLSTIMRPIRYGILTQSGEKIISGDISEDTYYTQYILMTPKQVIENKLGVCWDQVEFERYYCLKNDIPHMTFFDRNNIWESHTFLVFKTEDNKLYWFENSWDKQRGIHGPFTSIKDIFKTIIKLTHYDDKSPLKFYKYGKPQYGCTCRQFMKFATKHFVYKEGDS